MTTPRVLHLVSTFHQGGSERQALQVVRLLQLGGHYDVHLACLNREGALISEAEALVDNIVEYRLTSFRNLNALIQLRRLASFLRRHRIAIVHTHDFYSNVFGMAASALVRVPVRIAARRETSGLRTRGQKA